jgi:hypothetical protein
VLTSSPTALEVERANVAKLRAEAEKMNAETAKILQETRWYPVAALGVVVVGSLGALATIIVAAVRALH